jgi:hypothetical protein
MGRKKSNISLKQEKYLIENELLDGKFLFNIYTGNVIVATSQSINRLYQKLITEEKEQQEAQILRKARKAEQIYNDLKDKLISGKKYVVNVALSNGMSEAFMLNINTLEEVHKLLILGYREEVQEEYGSDSIFRANQIGVKSYSFTEITATHEIKNRDGSFFNYENKSNLDLTRFQILRENDDKKILNEQCLLHVLKLNGVSESLLNTIKLSSTNRAIPKKDIEKICSIIKKKIIIYFYRSKEENKENSITTEIHGKEYNEIINVAMYENHYFVYEKSFYSKFFIDNYAELKDVENNINIVRKDIKNSKIYYRRVINKRCNTLYLVNRLFKDGYFKRDTKMLLQLDDNASYSSDIIPLDNIDEEQDNDYSPKEKLRQKIFVADTETIVCDGEHKIYKIGVIANDEKITKICSANEDWTAKFFNYVKKRTPIGYQAVCFFHNLKYDFVASLKKHVLCSEPVIKDNNIFSVSITHNGFTIKLRDSYKLISAPLKDFTNIFKLPDELNKKEAINYTFYKIETLETDRHSVIEYIKNFTDKEKQTFYEAMKNKEFEYKNEFFNANKYYDYYLHYDCLVLKEGLIKFDKIIKTITGAKGKKSLSSYDSLTIASLAHEYMVSNGAYNNVYKVSGNLREFISKAVYGGRVNVYEPVKCKVLDCIMNDLDATSLYPSAMDRLTNEGMGIPKGKARRIENEEYENKDYYIVKIQITKINKQQKNPFIAIRKKDSIEYVNTITEPVIVYVDKLTLEDYIKFHEIEYNFLDGVYWNEGFNPKLGLLVKELFEERKRYKKEGADVIQNMVKLIMNSCYGKTIMKKSKTTILYLNKNKFNKENKEWTTSNENMNNYIFNNFNLIKSYKEINTNQIEITKCKMDTSYNIGHAGVIILSMSKRIMNEVMGLASDNNIDIFYQDTDSQIMKNDDIPKLSNLYKNEYKKDLIGSELGQFKSDYTLKGAVGDIVATKAIFLGKKSYICVLEGLDINNHVINGTHHRMKGMTGEGICNYVNKNCGGDYFTLYASLAEGQEIEMALNPNDKKVMFEYTKTGVRTRQTGEFKRTLHFPHVV